MGGGVYKRRGFIRVDSQEVGMYKRGIYKMGICERFVSFRIVLRKAINAL